MNFFYIFLYELYPLYIIHISSNSLSIYPLPFIQPDQINMAVFFWHLVENDSSSVHPYTGQITFYKVPETNGHV